jgi:hypothetical protein
VVAIYACNTAGDASLKAREWRILDRLKKKQAESLRKALAELPKKAPDLKKRQEQVKSEHALLLKQAIEEERNTWPKPGYEELLVSYGGDPDRTVQIKNAMGKESFAKNFRDQLAARNIAADVWGHTDPGHTSRNARMRLFGSDGKTYDLIRLVFGDTTEFKLKKQPSKEQVSWWWSRGDEKKAPLQHQQAVKKAALCSVASLDDDQRAFSLKSLIANFRGWYQ